MKNHNNYNEEKTYTGDSGARSRCHEILKEVEITISAEMFADAGINPYEELNLTVERGRIIIAPATVLGRIPEELLQLYEHIGISREKVEQILGEAIEKAGSFDAMVDTIKVGKPN